MNTITIEDIEKMRRLLLESQVKQHQFSAVPAWPLGVPIIESPHVQDLEPVIQLSSKVDVTPEFRAKCNRYYLDMFGYKEPMMFRTQYGILMGKNMSHLLATGVTA